MKRFSLGQLWRKRPGFILVSAGVILILAFLAIFLFTAGPNRLTQVILFTPTIPATPTALHPTPTILPTATPVPPTPTPTVQARTVSLNPAHGIHAPIGFQWTDPQR